MADPASSAAFRAIIHHVVLPPKLPNGNDEGTFEHVLLNRLLSSLRTFALLVPEAERQTVELALGAVVNFSTASDASGAVHDESLIQLFHSLAEEDSSSSPIPLHIAAQNAGMLVRKSGSSIIFESFELSPTNFSAISTKGRLGRQFPAVAVAIPIETFRKDGFQSAVASTIATMSHQEVAGMAARAMKSGQSQIEERETTNPALVTEMLVSFLRANGSPTTVTGIAKSTREEVMWEKQSLLPWRRSPVWLLLRVALQLTLSRPSVDGHISSLYKRFIVIFICELMSEACYNNTESDLIHTMNAKVARRLLKLRSEQHGPWLSHIHQVVLEATHTLEKRWHGIVEADGNQLEAPPQISPNSRAMWMDLPSLNQFIADIPKRQHQTRDSDFRPTSSLLPTSPSSFPDVASMSQSAAYVHHNLAVFEQWVATCLTGWLENVLSQEATCATIERAMSLYSGKAEAAYSGQPEGKSRMVLTLLELWIACDKSAITIHPLLAEYSAEVPTTLWRSLVLRDSFQMERLFQAEQYLQNREQEAIRASRPSIYTSFGEAYSFSVRYFASSSQLQELLSTIEKNATEHRNAKCQEFMQLKKKYQSLRDSARSRACTEETSLNSDGLYIAYHSDSCRRCADEEQAARLKIFAHEWPLPESKLEAQSTVFELQPPRVFAAWRDASLLFRHETAMLASLVLRNPGEVWPQNSYTCLLAHYKQMPRRRATLVSITKPQYKTHRRDKKMAVATIEDVCLNTGMTWVYYDDKSKRRIASSIPSSFNNQKFSDACTFTLPLPSAALQPFLSRPSDLPEGCSPNQVIAAQSKCPPHLSLDEFRALCSLPLGHRVVWLNILTQLAMPSVDWKKTETVLFITQLSCQAGPASDTPERETHSILREPSFAAKLLAALETSLDRVSENWESCQAVGIFISLTARLLSLGPQTATQPCLELLAKCRKVCLVWMELLRRRATETADQGSRDDCLQRVFEIALICVDSFNIDDQHLDSIFDDEHQAASFLSCSIAIQETTIVGSEQDAYCKVLVLRREQLATRVLPFLIEKVISKKSRCLDIVVKQTWSAYEPSDTWELMAQYWLVSQSQTTDTPASFPVHFNLLTAELLVNGVPLSKLPSEYEQNISYATFFGSSRLEAVPSLQPGFEFTSKQRMKGFQVDLGLTSTSYPDLLLHARRDDSAYELIPSRVINPRMPSSFIDDFVHWYDIKNHWIEFRPRSHPWQPSQTWRLIRVNSFWKLANFDGSWILDLFSTTATAFSKIFQPLTAPSGLHLSYHPSTKQTKIDIPALQLSFHIDQGSHNIKSLQFKGKIVRKSQGMGTLVGLKNKLVLCNEDDPRPCMVLIPEGRLEWQKSNVGCGAEHVSTIIDVKTPTRFQDYSLDRNLGRLIGNGSLQSYLFLAHLHAVTSHCVPDPFTSHTGTEMALSVLRSEAVRSFDSLSQDNVNILAQIESLSPRRAYYPSALKPMQVVKWDTQLGFMAQHGSFHTEVASLFRQTQSFNFFHAESSVELPKIKDGHVPHLLERDSIRSSTFRTAGFGAEDHVRHYDVVYKPRDSGQASRGSLRAFQTSLTLAEGRSSFYRSAPEDDMAQHLYKFLSKCNVPGKSAAGLNPQKLRYDSEWLEPLGPTVTPLWCDLHDCLSNTPHLLNKFQVMMWLTTIAFSEKNDRIVLRALIGFVLNSEMRSITVPDALRFDLAQGCSPNRKRLKDAVSVTRPPYKHCPERHIARLPDESYEEANNRRHMLFTANMDTASEHFVDQLVSQWPCNEPQEPTGQDFQSYIMCTSSMDLCRPIFAEWYLNKEFLGYLERICATLRATPVVDIAPPLYGSTKCYADVSGATPFITVGAAFRAALPLTAIPRPDPDFPLQHLIEPARSTGSQRLAQLLDQLATRTSSTHETSYVDHLRQSVIDLGDKNTRYTLVPGTLGLEDVLGKHRDQVQAYFDVLLGNLLSLVHRPLGYKKTPLLNDLSVLSIVAETHQWPRFSTNLFLQQLNRHWRQDLHDQWKRHIIELGLALTALQQAERLVRLRHQDGDLVKELQNCGPRTWSPDEYPDSLLLEIEGDLRIREVQQEIACQMRDPPKGENAVMQLNMGEGKSSVIVPIVAAALADGSKLLRVIVAKPQSKQMFEMLVSKLGGLIGRRIYHMPFSRQIALTTDEAKTIDDTCRECMRNGGILIVQPEHLLSFQLMAIDCFMSGRPQLGKALLETLHFFNTGSRDVVDESDENFSPKFELIYTVGQQRPIEYAPERWAIIQEILGLVQKYGAKVKKKLPHSIEINDLGHGRYPRTRLFHEDAHRELINELAAHICEYGLGGFPVGRQSPASRDAVRRYIAQGVMAAAEIDAVENGSFWTDTTKNTLLLLRGLLANGIISFALGQKRWRVNYGLDPDRLPPTKLAVPFRAKDNPTTRSEFSHPDSVIVMTCLCYYYEGLSDADIFLALQHLLKTDQASVEYELWAAGAPDLPEAFRHLDGVNIKDQEQCISKLFPLLRHSKGTIDYFMSHIVFAKEMREFPHKLSASGWDVAKVKTHPTTGFSGTNDSQHVLPLAIKQLDLHTQKHTNALVLDNLLNPDNSVVLMTEKGLGGVCSSEGFLQMISNMSPEIRVILDVGAQIIELTNIQVASTWLGLTSPDTVLAAVFCNDRDELLVLDRNGRTEPLQISPFAKQLDVCIVFLDEAHTRGIDLRLPQRYRAAVTLGANLTKDRLVQGK